MIQRADPCEAREPSAAPDRDITPRAGGLASWMLRGACRDEEPELFFPVGIKGAARIQAEIARAVCRRCAVQAQCLSYAVATRQPDGIWGGTTTEERDALARAGRRRAPHRKHLSLAGHA